jgi:hypothetical protein
MDDEIKLPAQYAEKILAYESARQKKSRASATAQSAPTKTSPAAAEPPPQAALAQASPAADKNPPQVTEAGKLHDDLIKTIKTDLPEFMNAATPVIVTLKLYDQAIRKPDIQIQHKNRLLADISAQRNLPQTLKRLANAEDMDQVGKELRTVLDNLRKEKVDVSLAAHCLRLQGAVLVANAIHFKEQPVKDMFRQLGLNDDDVKLLGLDGVIGEQLPDELTPELLLKKSRHDSDIA